TPSRLVEHLARPLGHPDLLAVGQGLHADARGLVAARIHQHHVREVDRSFALDDPALPHLLGGPLVLLDQVDALHHHAALLGDHAQHLALLAALLARHHHHRVALSHVRDRHDVPLDDLGGEGDDPRELLVAQLPSHRAEDAGPHRLVVGLQQDHRVAVEADVGAVAPADLLDRAHHHRPGYLALLHGPVRHRLLDRDHHHVPEGGVALVGAAHHPDAL